MRAVTLYSAAILAGVLTILIILAAGRTPWSVPVSPPLPHTYYAEPLTKYTRVIQTFEVHIDVSRVDMRIRTPQRVVALFEVFDDASGQLLRSTSKLIAPGDAIRTFEFPAVAASIEGDVYRPLAFAVTFPEWHEPGVGIAIDPTNTFGSGEVRAEGLALPKGADAQFRAYRKAGGFDIVDRVRQELAERESPFWLIAVMAGLAMVALVAVITRITAAALPREWRVPPLALVPFIVLALTVAALSGPFTFSDVRDAAFLTFSP